MVNYDNRLVRGRKERKYDFVSYLDELKSRVDIIQVAEQHGIQVNKHGQAECFNGHDEKTPSLTFYDDTQSYHCFGCKTHGDVISLVQHLKGGSFQDAVNDLAQLAGMEPFQSDNGHDLDIYQRISSCLNTAAAIYHGCLKPDDPYLMGRGVSYETAQRFMIGVARGRDDLRLSLLGCGFDEETMILSGVVKKDGTDFFQDHIVVPVTHHGKVVDFYGRSLGENGGQRHWRLPNDRMKLGDGLFNWNPRAQEIILVEGIFDALALIENGFDSAVATMGTNGLKDHHLRLIGNSRVDRILFCYDGDESGQASAVKIAYALESREKNVRIVELPSGQDPCDFFQSHQQEDFKALIEEALNPFEHELHRISGLPGREEQLCKVRDDLLPRVKKADPICQPDLIKKIHEELDIGVRALNEQLRLIEVPLDSGVSAEESEVLDLQTINPALDLVDGTMILLAPQKVRSAGNPIPRWQNTVITSARESFVLTHQELSARDWHAPSLERVDVRIAEERYSRQVIEGFLNGSLNGDIAAAFREIRRTLKLYLDFTDERTYDYLACWIIGTYFFPVFSHYPYVHFTGPKGSGKSQCLHVLRNLCHNGKIAGSMTLAVQFRLIGALQPTLLFDEMENLGQTQHTELHRMLKYGFERNGPEVWRMESSQNRMEMSSWSVYCPRAFASIDGMEDVIASRSVQIIMERSYSEEIKNRTVNADDPIWQKLRDQIFLVTMEEGQHIKRIHDTLQKPHQINYSGRDWDIFKGILVVAEAIGDEQVKERVIGFAVQSHRNRLEQDNDNSPDMIILNYLSEVVTTSGWYELGALHKGLTEKATSQGLDLQGAMTKERFGKRLSGLKVYEKRHRVNRNGEKVMEYWMEPNTIIRKLENHLQG
jgi:DNA primase catalytic core